MDLKFNTRAFAAHIPCILVNTTKQPRPRGAFSWLFPGPTSKAREKRPGDEVDNKGVPRMWSDFANTPALQFKVPLTSQPRMRLRARFRSPAIRQEKWVLFF